NPFLVFIAFFVYMGAAEEAATVQAELAFRGVPVRLAMMTRFATLAPTDSLARAVEHLLAGAQHEFPVMGGRSVVGPLHRRALVNALGQSGPLTPVSAVMQATPAPVSPSDSLESTFQRMRETEAQTLPVVQDGTLVGLITLENIGEFLMVRTALDA